MYIPSLNHDFKHLSSLIVLILHLIRCSLSVYFTPKNTRLGSDNITGIKNILIAIRDK